MKSNRNDTNGGYLCGVSSIPDTADVNGAVNQCEAGETWVRKYAEYLATYIGFYADAGIQVKYLGWLNEPDLNVTYASMHADGRQAGEIGIAVKDELRRRGLDVHTACCEATGWQQQSTMLAELATDASAVDAIDVVTAHGYASAPKLPLTLAGMQKEVWQSEWADLDGDWRSGWDVLGKAGEGLVWANIVQDSLTISDVSGFLYWQGAENASTNSALIAIDGDEVVVSKRLWAIAMFSRWVRPGAVRVGCSSETLEVGEGSGSGGLVSVSAFVNEVGGEGMGAGNGEVVVVAVNNAHWDVSARMEVGGMEGMQGRSVARFVTDNYRNATDVGGVVVDEMGGWDAVLPMRSMVTFVL